MNYESRKFAAYRDDKHLKDVVSVCIGSGKFLRAVLVPAVSIIGGVIIAQPRGTNFVKSMNETKGVYEVDTVLIDGSVETKQFQIEACGTLSNKDDRVAFMNLPKRLPNLSVIGVGITEAGFNANNPTIKDLADFLGNIFSHQATESLFKNISVLNTDNVFPNGTKLYELISEKKKDQKDFMNWLNSHVTFHNSMVDRITSFRESDVNVPRAEPLPAKALVIEDTQNRLPEGFKSLTNLGVRICSNHTEILNCILLKLLIANATHTSMVYSMALSGFPGTSTCIKNQHFLKLVEGIFWQDIHPGFAENQRPDAVLTFNEWKGRLQHPHFEMSSFFVCQNATQKLLIRIVPTVTSLISTDNEPSDLLAFSIASMFRFLTPTTSNNENNVFTGRLPTSTKSLIEKKFVYGDNLFVDRSINEYQFRNDSHVSIPNRLRALYSDYTYKSSRNDEEIPNILADLIGSNTTNASSSWSRWFKKISDWYFVILNDESRGLDHYHTLGNAIERAKWLELDEIKDHVMASVESTPAIDVHTHLFPQSHGSLLLYGIDELLTYHYLVAEYFMVAPSNITPRDFYKLEKKVQADMIWETLFIKRSPISEACQGVITTLKEFGLAQFVKARNLQGIRKWTEQFSSDVYVEKIFKLANVKYCVMTNIPYEEAEKQKWLQSSDKVALTNSYFRSALRIDAFLQSDWQVIADILASDGFEQTKQGLSQYLEKWIAIMSPEYLMASLKCDFEYPGQLNLLDGIILPICKKYNLAIAMKFGAERGVVNELASAGDGVKVVDLQPLINMCRNNPSVKFLATFLSRVNQHELCVVANKFRNLHIYGCWWYCNNPSIIAEMTRMRVEMLGSAFTAQHSDARVLDQLVYKWKHSRRVIGQVLTEQYTNLFLTGWKFSKSDVNRDIARYFGEAYEEFLEK